MELFLLVLFIPICIAFIIVMNDIRYKKTTAKIQKDLGLNKWLFLGADDIRIMKSGQAVDKYSYITYLKEDRARLEVIEETLDLKLRYADLLNGAINSGKYDKLPQYKKVKKDMEGFIRTLFDYNIKVAYSSPTGRSTREKTIRVFKEDLDKVKKDPSMLMTKGEYNQYLKAQGKEQLEAMQHNRYEQVNVLIDLANLTKDNLIIKSDAPKLDNLMASLFDRTVNSIKKIKSFDSEEWGMIDGFINKIHEEVLEITRNNQRIAEYYDSEAFAKIKDTCKSLMESQKEFNAYIDEKAQSISSLFGTRIVRSETEVNDEYNYIRPYKKSLTPFNVDLSAGVFASAENNPVDYIIKYFYPNKDQYPEQIQKLQLLIEELETLREAKEIIENHKKEYAQYITDVPNYVMENDEDGFYKRLGFADISESVLTVEYKFSYTSNGGMAQRSFTVPMTEETIVNLINALESKLTMTSFTKEQRALMTSKLRQHIKERDDYTCKECGNSTHKEPNLLLEIDHIVPVSKGGYTVEENLQTLCWKCNRSKGAKL